jgi:hypothetical protein
MTDLEQIKRIIDVEYHDVLADIGSEIYHGKLRAFIIDGSYIDVWLSLKIPGRFSFHWERRHIDSTLYRHDNFPDLRWKDISSFPRHFHEGSQENLKDSPFDDDPSNGVRQFMNFVRQKLLDVNNFNIEH